MKSPALLLLFIIALLQATAQEVNQYVQSTNLSNEFYPLSVGNYWVYSNSRNKLLDTVRIIKSYTYEKDIVYTFSNGQNFLSHGDTIYEMQNTESSQKDFPALQFYPSNKDSYSYIIEGDVIAGRTVRKLKKEKCKAGGLTYSECYEFSSGIDIITICRGVGIIERFNRQPYLTRTLVTYHLESK